MAKMNRGFPRRVEWVESIAQSKVWRNRKDMAGIKQVTESWQAVQDAGSN